MLSKEQERLFKRNSHLRDNFRYPFMLPDLLPTGTSSKTSHIDNEPLQIPHHHPSPSSSVQSTNNNNNPFKQNIDLYPSVVEDRNSSNSSSSIGSAMKDGLLKFTTDYFTSTSKDHSKEVLDEILLKRGGSFLKEGLRFNPMSMSSSSSSSGTGTPATATTTTTSSSSSSSSSSSTSTIVSSIKAIPESLLMPSSLSDCQIEEETKCTVCMASFPSVWLLEQHAALQHSNTMEDKPFICDQCGQSYRFAR